MPDALNRLLKSATTETDRTDAGSTAARSGEMDVLWIVAIHTGLRDGELLALTSDDVDIERGRLTVRRNLVRTHDQTPLFGEPKSQTSRRTVSLPATVIQLLRTHTAHQPEDRLATDYWAPFNLVFCSHVGAPLLRRNLLRAFKVALARAGLPETIHFRDVRHAHATLLLRAGVLLKTASAARSLGHHDHGRPVAARRKRS